MIYIGTSTHFRIRFVNNDALDQQVISNRVDAGTTGPTAGARNNGLTTTIRPMDRNPTTMNGH